MKNLIVRQQSGFSLVQVMIALGLTGVLSMVIMKNMSLQSKAQKTIELQANQSDMRRMLQDFMGRTEPCNASIGGATRGAPIQMLKQKDDLGSATPFAKVGEEFQKSGYIITDMRLMTLKEQITANNGDTGDLSDTGTGLAYLKVKIQKIVKQGPEGPTSYGGQDKAMVVPVYANFTDDIVLKDGHPDQAAAAAAFGVELKRMQDEQDALLAPEGFAAGQYKVRALDLADANYLSSCLQTDPKCKEKIFQVNPDVLWYVSVPVFHPNFIVSDCGNHLSSQ